LSPNTENWEPRTENSLWLL